jgi:hypothetical protein
MRHAIRDLKWQIGMLSKDQSRRKIVLTEGLNRVERPAIRGHKQEERHAIRSPEQEGRNSMLLEELNQEKGKLLRCLH